MFKEYPITPGEVHNIWGEIVPRVLTLEKEMSLKLASSYVTLITPSMGDFLGEASQAPFDKDMLAKLCISQSHP